MQSCCFGFRQHRGRWAVFSAAFHHAERAPRVTSSLTAESPTIRSFSTILGVDIRTLATRVRRARKTRKSEFGLNRVIITAGQDLDNLVATCQVGIQIILSAVSTN